MNILKRFIKIRESGLLIICVLFIAFLSIKFPNFATRQNFLSMLYSISVNTFLLGSTTWLFVAGGFDLSIGATLGFSGILVGQLMVKLGLPIVPAIIFTLIGGAIIGLLQGSIITYLKVNPFIVTLAGWFIIDSVKLMVSHSNIFGFPEGFENIASSKILGLPIIIIASLFLMIVFDFLLRKNSFVRKNYYIGGNEEAAYYFGINVKRIKLTNYMVSGLLASVAGIFLASRFNGAYIDAGAESTFLVITAVIMGGASLKGGRGSVIGSFLGMVIMTLINNALILFKVNIRWNKVVIGVFLVLVVILDVVMHTQRERIKKDRAKNR